MLRINLLPPYIYAGKTKGRVVVVWVVILVAVIGGLLFFQSKINAERDRFLDDANKLEPTAAKADKDAQDATNINQQSEAVRNKANFVKNARTHNIEVYPNVYRNVVMYTWNRVLYDYIRPEGSTIGMSAYTPSLTDVAHYLMAMERNPNISRVDIRMSSIPGFPDGAAAQQGGGQDQAGGIRPEGGGGHNFLVTLNLYKPIPAGPTYGGGAGGGGQQGGGQMPGMPGMPGSGGGGMSMMSGGGPSSGGGMMMGGKSGAK